MSPTTTTTKGHTMRTATIAAVLILITLTLALRVGHTLTDTVERSPLRTALTIEEDEAGWNCATMGNRICGPVAR